MKLLHSWTLEENLSIATIRCHSWKENVFQPKINHFGSKLEGFGYPLSINRIQNPSVDNQNDLDVHFLIMSRNG